MNQTGRSAEGSPRPQTSSASASPRPRKTVGVNYTTAMLPAAGRAGERFDAQLPDPSALLGGRLQAEFGRFLLGEFSRELGDLHDNVLHGLLGRAESTP